MTPCQFADLYRNMDVYMVPLEAGSAESSPLVPHGEWRRTRVASYRLGDSAFRKGFFDDVRKHFGKTGVVSVLVKTIAGVQVPASFLTADEAWAHFRHPFVGKGTPEQVQVAIQLTYRFHKTSAAFQDVNKFTAATFIGLDCNGFVGNYIQRGRKPGDESWTKPGNYSDPGPNTAIESLLKMAGNTVLKSKDEIKPGSDDIYILAMCTDNGLVYNRLQTEHDGKSETHYGHIMISEPGTVKQTGDMLTFHVVESTGGAGLTDSDYVIQSVKTTRDNPREGIFTVLRGSKNNSAMQVKIARLGG